MDAPQLFRCAIATAAAASAVFATSAVAYPGHEGTVRGPRTRWTPARTVVRSAPPTVKDTSLAGYKVNEGGVHSFNVTTTFTVPHIGCGSATKGITASIGMGTTSTYTTDGLFIGCYNDKAHYWPFLEYNGHDKNYPKTAAAPGDTIVLRAFESKSRSYLSVVNKSTGTTKTVSGGGASSLAFPWVGDQSWNLNGEELGVPHFDTLRYSRSFVNGTALGAWPTGVVRYNRVSTTGTKQIETGSLSRNREAFVTAFKHS